jgi:hypothetical protein
MKISNRQQGQTLIETALILLILLIIVLGITEFARAWFTKNSLNNAARQGARVAAVTPTANITTSFKCIEPYTCPLSDVVSNAVCCQPGVPKKPGNDTTVSVTCLNQSGNSIGCGAIVSDGTVRVNITSIFEFIIGDSPWPWQKTTNMSVGASMRYE